MDNWMIEYKELILKGEKRAARELVLAEIPDDKIIYKYFRGINRDFDTIKVPELWLCNAYRLNDPFDCAFVKGSGFDKHAKQDIYFVFFRKIRFDDNVGHLC